MKFTLALSLICLTFPAISQSSEDLKKIFEEIENIKDIEGVDDENNVGFRNGHPKKYVFPTLDDEFRKEKIYQEKINALNEIELTDRQDQISRDVMIYRLQNNIDYVKYKMYLVPYNAEGGFYSQLIYTINRLPFNTVKDYEDYMAWLPSYTAYIDYNIELLKQGIDENIMRPKVIIENNINLLQTWVTEDLEHNPLARPFFNTPDSFTDEDKALIEAKGTELMMSTILPSYRKLNNFLKETYLPAAPAKEGISNITNGKEYYENRVKYFTTLNISPDSVFELGVAEVARIRSAMEQIIIDLEFEGDFDAFLEFLRTDPQFYARTPRELLSRAAWLSKKAEGQLPQYFSKLYDLPFTVEPVPDAIAPNYTGGRYVPGSRSQNRPGIYWVNTYDLSSRTLYTLPALTVHESVPGHHLDMAMTAELEDVPNFRKYNYISAYGEGWGLYSEYLGEEMGMYETPYEWFGRYTYEMWRACRLVVDVGMHYKGWSRQEAIDYLASNSALSMHEVNTEIDRYIGWPGQALSYKVGELTIKQLRKEATEQLGDDFDIQKFHLTILSNGSVPLPILREEVEAYIALENNK